MSVSLGQLGSAQDSAVVKVALVGPISVICPRTITPLMTSCLSIWAFHTTTEELVLRMLRSLGRVSLNVAPYFVGCWMIPMGMIILVPRVLAGIIRKRFGGGRWTSGADDFIHEKGPAVKSRPLVEFTLVLGIHGDWVGASDEDYLGPPASLRTRRRAWLNGSNLSVVSRWLCRGGFLWKEKARKFYRGPGDAGAESIVGPASCVLG